MFLSQSPWAAVGVWQRGDAWKEGHFHEHAGFTVYISEAPFNAYEEQFKDATDFLRHFGDELARLGKAATQIEVTLCFGMAQKNALDWGIVIPNELVVLAGKHRIGFAFSFYAVSEMEGFA